MNHVRRLGIGTAQWGLEYGVTNSTGKPPLEEVLGILHVANCAGIDLLDTAWAYGDSEEVIGKTYTPSASFQIVTKTLPLKQMHSANMDLAHAIHSAFLASLTKLGQSKVYGLLVHHADDLLGPNGSVIWQVLEKLKKGGHVEKIGCSLYQPDQFFQLQKQYRMDLLQIPFNIYDQRYVTSGMAEAAKKEGIEVHARSIFLQGILLCPPSKLPIQSAALKKQQTALWRQYQLLDVSPVEAALGFCLICPHLDRVLIGCEKPQQLAQSIMVATQLSTKNKLEIFSAFAISDESIINPSKWGR
jgi:aryl-alcohol dehydrogenase-like predicted oxidoreductase